MSEFKGIKISNGNSKLGKIPNLSLIPVKDCGNCDSCMSDCYALKSQKQYPNVRKAWKTNSVAFRDFRTAAYNEVSEWFQNQKKPPRFFRIHVAGDFLDQGHVNFWRDIAIENPETKFLAFTKMHGLDYSDLTKNMTVVFSLWPGMELPEADMPKAWVQDGTETRIPSNAIECPGICDDCGMCWNLPELGRDVYFEMH